ncbi:ATP-binding protein [Nocardioides sp. GY 10127]|uniref:ATP-binding protein n=1 Tax=Nocardioides sp. GY 10127 TaxID=2569762 RepID=UPI0014582974|nr:ATP-binding protein [Nocardioides sp. GY 10127]
MTDQQISIRPGVGMLGLFPHMKYQPWYALGELVDNAIQSHLAHKQALLEVDPDHRLRVSIQIDRQNNTITITDNAAGIAARDWERAFRVAEPPEDATGLSQFGVGMKAACCWFAKVWQVESVALGESTCRSVDFDVPRIIASRDESIDVVETYADMRDHWTRVSMRDLRRPVAARTLGKIREYLGGIYRQFLRDGELELTVNGDLVQHKDPAVLEAPRYNDRGGEPHRWSQDVDITLDSGRRVRGFVAIREKGAAKSAGLALFYRRKVVTGSGEEFYKPDDIFKGGNSFESQRVFGELHMDDFNVTYTKDALVWYDEEEEFLEKLRAVIDAEPWPLLRQAREHRMKTPEQAAGEVASKALAQIATAFVDVEHEVEPATSEETSGERGLGLEHQAQTLPVPGETAEPPADPISRTIELSVQGSTWTVELRLVADDAVSRWLTVERPADDTVVITLNQSHPFMRAWCELPSQELEPVWRVAVALGLGQEMARMSGAVMPGLVTENVNTVLRTVLSRKS